MSISKGVLQEVLPETYVSAAVDPKACNSVLPSISRDKRRQLVICSSRRKNFLKAFGVGPNVVWLSQEPDERRHTLPANLRLDSHWYTFSNSLDTGPADIMEHYRIKKNTEVLCSLQKHRDIYCYLVNVSKPFCTYVKKRFFMISQVSQLLGTWSNLTHDLQVERQYIWKRRGDLRGVTLYDALLNFSWSDFNFIKEGKDFPNFDGFYPRLMKILKDRLNFKSEAIMSKLKAYGRLKTLENGTKEWVGLVGMLSSREADISTSGLTINSERAAVNDYTIGLIPDPLTLVIRNPGLGNNKVEVNMDVFYSVFTPELWLATVGIGFVIMVTYIFVACGQDNKIKSPIQDSYGFRAIDGWAFFCTMFVQLELEQEDKKRVSFYILALISAFMTYMLYQCYVGDTTARMTVDRSYSYVRSFDEALSLGYTFYISGSSIFHTIFSSAPKDSGMRRAFEAGRVIELHNFGDFDGRAKFIVDNPLTAMFHTARGFRKYKELRSLMDFQDLVKTYMAISLQKDSEFTALFNYELIRLWEIGVIPHLLFTWGQASVPKDVSDRFFVGEANTLGFKVLAVHRTRTFQD